MGREKPQLAQSKTDRLKLERATPVARKAESDRSKLLVDEKRPKETRFEAKGAEST